MKKFNFKLQKILEIREHLEKEQKSKLAQVATEYQKLISKQEQLAQKMALAREKLPIDSLSVNLSQLKFIDHFQDQVDSYNRGIQPQLTSIKEKLKQEQAKYNKLHQEKRAIEVLKESELKKYNYSLLKKESSQMDEIAKNLFTQHQTNSKL